MTAPIPCTLVTGFLGSGKTTLVNRILAERSEEKIAAIENEFGSVSIDHALLAHEAAREQVAFADVLLIGKRDRTDEKQFSGLVQRLTRTNPRAVIHTMSHGDVPLHAMVDVNAFNLTSLLEIDLRFLDDAHHHHHDDIAAFVYRSERAFDEDRLEDFMAHTITQHHPHLLRYKGILNLAGEPHQVALQGVHMTVYGDRVRLWPEGAARASTPVFIGRTLPEAELRAGLDTCLV